MKQKNVLLIVDRDGTLIKNNNFFGKNNLWKKEIGFNQEVINFLYSVRTKFKTTKIVLSNQAGVARRLFTTRRVVEIDEYIDRHLRLNGIKIDNWQYCPDVDSVYAKKHPEIKFLPNHVKIQTKRKPRPDMLLEGLKALKLRLDDFDKIVIIGDREEDYQLANNVGGSYLDVKGKSYKELLVEFTRVVTSASHFA